MTSAVGGNVYPETEACPDCGKRTGTGTAESSTLCPWCGAGTGENGSGPGSADYGDFSYERTDVVEFYEREYPE